MAKQLLGNKDLETRAAAGDRAWDAVEETSHSSVAAYWAACVAYSIAVGDTNSVIAFVTCALRHDGDATRRDVVTYGVQLVEKSVK